MFHVVQACALARLGAHLEQTECPAWQYGATAISSAPASHPTPPFLFLLHVSGNRVPCYSCRCCASRRLSQCTAALSDWACSSVRSSGTRERFSPSPLWSLAVAALRISLRTTAPVVVVLHCVCVPWRRCGHHHFISFPEHRGTSAVPVWFFRSQFRHPFRLKNRSDIYRRH